MFKKLLFLLGGALLSLSTQAQTSPYEGATVKAGDFYLYNVESGLWMQSNTAYNDVWTTRAELGTRGFDVELIAKDGGWQINPKFGSNHSLNGTDDFLYMDTGRDVTVWTFEPVEVEGVTNAYRITTGSTVLGANSANRLANISEKTTWQLVSKEERVRVLSETTTADEPHDASWLIKGPEFANADERYNSWTGRGGRGGDQYAKNMCVEFWQYSSINMYQDLTDLPDGNYKFTVQGFYRDGKEVEVGEKYKNGTENLRGIYFAGDAEGTLMSIVAGGRDEKVENAWVTLQGDKYIPGNTQGDYNAHGAASNCFFQGGYQNPEIDVTVIGGNLRIGVKKTEGVADDWLLIDNFKLTYYGPVDISEYTNALEEAISAAQAYTGSTTDVLAARLASALEAAIALRGSRDTDAISAATGALVAALAAAQDLEVGTLRATLALAEAEGADYVDQAKEFVAKATVKGNYNDLLYTLRSSRKLNAAVKVDPAKVEGSAPDDGGQYYLMNVGAGLFLDTTSDWGSHISIDNIGMLLTLTRDGDGSGQPAVHIKGNGWDGLNWQEEYWDKNGEHKSIFRPVAGKENVYYWNVFDNTRWHFVYDVTDGATDAGAHTHWNAVQKRETDQSVYENDVYAQWKLVTKEQLLASLYAASESAPVDATFLIENPNFNKVAGDRDTGVKRGWEGVGTICSEGRDPWFVIEYFERNADLKQTLKGLPAGKYQVSVTGFYRDGSSDNEAGKVGRGEELVKGASLVAYTSDENKVAEYLPNVTSEAGRLPGVGDFRDGVEGAFANWPVQANDYFQTGLYRTTTDIIEVGEDGELTIGVESTYNGTLGSWVVVDNFRLTYLGEEKTVGLTNGYATFSANRPYEITTEGVKAYKVVKNTETEVEPAEIGTLIPANTGVMLYGAGASEATLKNVGVATADVGDNMLVANVEASELPQTQEIDGVTYKNYLLGKDDDDVKFFLSSGKGQLAAGRAYLAVPQATDPAAKLTIVWGDETAIEAVETAAEAIGKADVYDLQGRKVNVANLNKGIYIVNGKKMVVK